MVPVIQMHIRPLRDDGAGNGSSFPAAVAHPLSSPCVATLGSGTPLRTVADSSGGQPRRRRPSMVGAVSLAGHDACITDIFGTMLSSLQHYEPAQLLTQHLP